jgi:serine/threonine-protein kinase
MMHPEIIGGKYRIIEPIGKGGMAQVYRGVHTGTGHNVAVKVMLGAVATEEESLNVKRELVQRFEREAKLAGSVETQHIVRVYDTGLDEATKAPFIVMELLTGEDVSALIKRIGPLHPDLALRIVTQACMGLTRAHGAGVVHRDIKPGNIYLARSEFGDYVVKLVDFGIAKGEKLDSTDSKTLTQTGAMLGSPHYMSPEQAIGDKKLDLRADIWSLGVVLFKCLTGRTPYDVHDTVGAIIVGIVSTDPPSVQDYAPWVSPEIAHVINRALQRDRNLRYQTADEMLAELRPLLHYGLQIDGSMLVGVTEEQRQMIQQRAPVGLLDKSSTSLRDLNASIPSAGALAAAGPSSSRLVTGEPETRLEYTRSGDHTKPRSRVGLLAVLAVLLGLAVIGGVLALIAIGGGRGKTVAAAVPNAPASAPMPVEPPPPSLDPTPTQAAAAAPKTTTVSVTVTPANAKVDVDGTAAEVKNGTVSIAGELGSVHEVRLRASGRETKTEIIVTEQGARPSSIALGPAQAAAVGARPGGGRPTGTATAPAGNFDRKFE